MLKYVGNPIVDVGVATILAYYNYTREATESLVDNPEGLTDDKIFRFVKYIEGGLDIETLGKNGKEKYIYKNGDFLEFGVYFNAPTHNYTWICYPNSPYTQPDIGVEKLKIFLEKVTRGFLIKDVPTNNRCIFCGRPAVAHYNKSLIPLFTGEGVLSCLPQKYQGDNVCGYCSIAVQAFLLGTIKCGGKLLFLYTDNKDILEKYTSSAFEENYKYILETTTDKWEDFKNNPKTGILECLTRIVKNQDSDENFGTVSAYHLTNYNEKSDITIYDLSAPIIRFITIANSADYKNQWNSMVNKEWYAVKKDNKDYRNNSAYESLFELPMEFIHKFFIRKSPEEVSWELTRIFAKEVMRMEDYRIERIGEIADNLAEYILKRDDKKTFGQIYQHQNHYESYRNLLIRLDKEAVGAGLEPIITLQDFVEVFTSKGEGDYFGWKLGRDLILIRLIETLYRGGWFSKEEVKKELAKGENNIKDEIDEISEDEEE